jgi:opacity protein-like surface antigen
MRKLAIAVALASTALATPAVARDHSFYAGIEGGAMLVEDMDLDYTDGTTDLANALTVDHDLGYDVDVIAGYDFGMVRLEGELAYKRASTNESRANLLFSGGGAFDNFPTDGHGRAISAMLNLLLDFGNEDGLSGYAGAGVGIANVRYSADIVDMPFGDLSFDDSDSGLAWQAILGLRYAVSQNIDVGLKYRFFNVPNLKFEDSDIGGRGPFVLDGRWRSHSLLASVIYNFWSPPPPPAPPPPPPPPAPERG